MPQALPADFRARVPSSPRHAARGAKSSKTGPSIVAPTGTRATLSTRRNASASKNALAG